MGIPMIMDLLQSQVLYHVKTHIQEPNYNFFAEVSWTKNWKNLKCSLEYSQFTNRYSSVSQKIHPIRNLGRKLFEEEDIDIVLSVDEIFLRFRETTKKVLAPKRVKRAGVAFYVNEKNGCSVMITLDVCKYSIIPFIIFTGVFGSILMNEYNDMTKATVLFTDTYYMTSATNMLYFKYLSNFYRDKKMVLYMTKYLVIVVKM